MAKRKRRYKLPNELGIAPALEKKGHVVRLEETMIAGQRRARIITTRPLDRYFEKGHIDVNQFSAGDRFGRDWYAGCKSASLIGAYEVRITGSPVGIDSSMDARARVLSAIRAMSNRLYPILIHVCGLELSASSWAKLANEPERSGIVILRFALNDLLDIYKRG